jgi:hypothetical protein
MTIDEIENKIQLELIKRLNQKQNKNEGLI